MMSKLEELIAELCPDGVEYYKIGQICYVEKGKTPIQKAEPGEYPLVTTAEGRLSCNTYQFDCEAVCIPLISSRGHGVASLNKLYYQSGKFALGNILCAVMPLDSDKVDAKFLCIYLNHKKDVLLVPLMRGGANVSLTTDSLKNVKVPLPPLEIQREIVHILDEFTLYQNELAAELAARKKQYEYYKRQLLCFEDNAVKRMKLGDIGRVAMCKRILKQDTNKDSGVPFFKIGTFGKTADAYITEEKFNEFKAKYSFPKKGDILISAAGTIGRTVIYDGIPAYFQDSNIVWLEHDESVVLNKYLYYQYSLSPWAVQTGGTIARLYNDNIAKAEIPVPPLAEQQRIVDILDRFDKLCNDISEGLPAEIELRRKQYEYYRDKLLTFKMKEA